MHDNITPTLNLPASSPVKAIAIADIQISNRLRPAGEQGVATLLASIEEVGDITDAIHVKKIKSGGYRLIDGGHRLEAAKRLGRTEIMARVWSCTDAQARLMEVDCNLAGAELTPLDNALHLAERKRVYEELHPETKRGVAGGLARQGLATELGSFAAVTADKFGISERQVQKIVKVGEVFSTVDIDGLRQAPQSTTLKDLMALAKVHEPIMRSAAIGRLAAGESKTVAEAVVTLTQKDKPKNDPTDEVYLKLLAAWKRAPKAAQRRFVRTAADDLAELLAELQDEAAA